jgi:hypothetical protein
MGDIEILALSAPLKFFLLSTFLFDFPLFKVKIAKITGEE